MESFSVTLAMERELLGSLIHYPEMYTAYAHHINPQYFSNECHQNLLHHIRELFEENILHDAFTLKQKLIQQHEEETVSCLNTLPDKKLSDAQTKKYLYCIKNEYVRMHMLRAVLDVSALCENELTDIKPALSLMDNTLQLAENIHAKHACSPLSEVLQQVKHQLQLGMARDNSLPWFSRPMQVELHGLENGELTVVASRPGVGKTAFALSQVYHLISQGIPVIYVTTEHSRAQLAFRLLSMHSNKDVYDQFIQVENEYSKAELQELVDQTIHWPIELMEDSGMRIHKLMRICRQRQAITQARLIVFDTIQQLQPSNNQAIRDVQVGDVVMQMKRLAKSLNIPVLALSQLNRSPEYRGSSSYPILSDLRDSGYIETVADKVMMLYRAEYYGITEDEYGESTANVADLVVAKNRNGKTSTIRLMLNKPALRFEDMPTSPLRNTSEVQNDEIPASKPPRYNYERDIPGSRLNELNTNE